MMLILKYKLRIFKDEFNAKIRKDVSTEEKFSTIKKELKAHLKTVDAKLEDLPELKIWSEGYDLYFEYTETTGTRMKIGLFWASYIFDKDKLETVADTFMNTIKLKKEKRPLITYTDETMRNTYGLYYPDQNTVLMSRKFVQSHDLGFVIRVLKHEILHAFCHIMGIPASDTDEPFIRLLIKHNAYISQEKSAQEAYQQVCIKMMSENFASVGVNAPTGISVNNGVRTDVGSTISKRNKNISSFWKPGA